VTYRSIFVARFLGGCLFWACFLAPLSFAQTPVINLGGNRDDNIDGLRQRAEAGDVAAQFELGLKYHEGQGVEQDYIVALHWFRMAADQGDADSQFNLGVMYEKGRGVPPNYEEAMRWYQKAALHDYAPAEYNLAVMFDKARGVPLDFAEAMRWYRKSADQSYAPAQYNLGLLYFYGQGIPQNYVLAYLWISLAVSKAAGDDEKKFSQMRVEIAAKMTRQQIADAEKLVQVWKPASGN
jgi:TPR repeat protein